MSRVPGLPSHILDRVVTVHVAGLVELERELRAASSELEQKSASLALAQEALAAAQEAGVIITYPDKAPFMEAVAEMKASYDGTEVGRYLRAIEAVE